MLRKEPNLPSLPAATHKIRIMSPFFCTRSSPPKAEMCWCLCLAAEEWTTHEVFWTILLSSANWPWLSTTLLKAVPLHHIPRSQDQPLLCLCHEASCFIVLNWLQNNSWCESKTLCDALPTSPRPSIPAVSSGAEVQRSGILGSGTANEGFGHFSSRKACRWKARLLWNLCRRRPYEVPMGKAVAQGKTALHP